MFTIGDFVKLRRSLGMEGKVQGYKVVHEETNAVITLARRQYLVKFMGDPIWVDEDHLVRTRSRA